MKATLLIGGLMTAGLIFSGCGSEESAEAPVAHYKVTVTNLTYAQPMSPMAVVLHTRSMSLFMTGMKASKGLEQLAEGGDNTMLLAESGHAIAAQGGNGLIAPGKTDSVMLEGNGAECISLATMLINTNDAFAGSHCIDVTALQVGQTLDLAGLTYDAGTEKNTEGAVSIPGPAGGGEGYNALRDDRDFVTVHGGIVSADDGLSGSALSLTHRWDNPALHIHIKRMQ